jgi:hypothetical protein
MLLASSGELPKVVAVVRNVYEENFAALSAFGTIHFHATDGELGRASSAEEIQNLLKSDWKRRSKSQGLFVFDGQNRRYENLYPPEELIARRMKLSDSSWSSPIDAVRLLLDGETTLRDDVNVDIRDDKTVIHTPNCYKGIRWFFAGEHIPLRLTDPEPPISSLGGCLRDLMAGDKGVTLVGVDESARLDGISVVKLSFELPNPRRQITFWVDLEHGAIPVQTRDVEEGQDQRTLPIWQENLTDVRRVSRGWLPFRMTHVLGQSSKTRGSGDPPSSGAFSGLFVRETIVDAANFERRPEPTVFALEFPEEVGVADSDRMLAYGRRRVWTLKDISPAAQARARRINIRSPFPAQSPAMPGALDSGNWGLAVLVILGLACLLTAGALSLRRWLHHAT